MSTDSLKKGAYRHYKGNYYELIDTELHSETLEPLVIYRALYGKRQLWARPAEMWNQEVATKDGKTVKRFEYVGESDAVKKIPET